MQQVLGEFEERVKEIDLYFKFLAILYEPGASIRLANSTSEELDPDFLKMLKANVFLVLYNLVESSIREGVCFIYEELKVDNRTYETVRTEIRTLWVNYKYRLIFKTTANWDSGRKMAAQLIDHAMNKLVIELDEEALPISGNLDARQIRDLCSSHGIAHTTPKNAKGGRALLTVKDQRNALSHGHLSFSECGRQFELVDLRRIKDETVIFVRSILENMEYYINNKQYA